MQGGKRPLGQDGRSQVERDHVHGFAAEFSSDVSCQRGRPAAWRGDQGGSTTYADIPGFCKSATLDDISKQGHILTPGRYVGAEEIQEDDEPFEDKMRRLVSELNKQTEMGAALDQIIRANLEDLGYGK